MIGIAKKEPIDTNFLPKGKKTFRMNTFGNDINPTGPAEEAELDRMILSAQNQDLQDQSIETLRKVTDLIKDKANFRRMKTIL